MRRPAAYLTAGAVLGVLDVLWLTVVAAPLYAAEVEPMLASGPDPIAAGLFYLVYIVGVVHLVVLPAVTRGGWMAAAGRGGLLGLVAYGTWGLTNRAVLAGWPWSLTLIDVAWGVVVTTATAVTSCAVTAAVDRRAATARPSGRRHG